MNRPERTDKECRRQGMRDVPVANYSKMQDKYINHLESKVKALSTPVVRKSYLQMTVWSNGGQKDKTKRKVFGKKPLTELTEM